MRRLIADIPSQPSDPDIEAFKDHIEGNHQKYDWKECLEVLIAIFECKNTNGKSPRTSDLASVLSINQEKVRRYVKAIGPSYIERSGKTIFINIDGKSYFGRDDMEKGFRETMAELKKLLQKEHEPDGPGSLYGEADRLMTDGDLFGAVKKYNQLTQKLNGSSNSNSLNEVLIRSLAYRYSLSGQGQRLVQLLLVMPRQPGPRAVRPGTRFSADTRIPPPPVGPRPGTRADST